MCSPVTRALCRKCNRPSAALSSGWLSCLGQAGMVMTRGLLLQSPRSGASRGPDLSPRRPLQGQGKLTPLSLLGEGNPGSWRAGKRRSIERILLPFSPPGCHQNQRELRSTGRRSDRDHRRPCGDVAPPPGAERSRDRSDDNARPRVRFRAPSAFVACSYERVRISPVREHSGEASAMKRPVTSSGLCSGDFSSPGNALLRSRV